MLYRTHFYSNSNLQQQLRESHVKNHENLIKQLSEFLGDNKWILGDEVIKHVSKKFASVVN